MFDESAATWIGNRGAVEFFTRTEDAASPDTIAALGIYDSDMKFRRVFIAGAGPAPDALQQRSAAGRDSQAPHRYLREHQSDYAELKPKLSGLERFDLDQTELNNAVLLNYLIYFHQLDDFAKLLALNHNDLRPTIKQIIALAKGEPGDPFFAIWKATHATSQGGALLPPFHAPNH